MKSDDSGDDHRASERADDTVQTKLRKATERCRRITERCAAVGGPGLRRPTPGGVERVDPKRLAKVRPPPPAREPEDPVARLIALVLRDRGGA